MILLRSSISDTHPDCVCSPCVEHPERPVIVWAAGSFLFAFNLETSKFEVHRLQEHSASIRSIEYCPQWNETSDSMDSVCGCWIIAGDNKQITILEDRSFRVRERFLLSKRPSAVRFTQNGSALIWGDKFGELFKCSITELRRLTERIIVSTVRHLEQNRKDSLGGELHKQILLKFAPDELKKFEADCDSIVNAPITEKDLVLNENASNIDFIEEIQDDVLTPFASQLAQITALEMSGDRKLLLSGDRDEKVRVGSVKHPFVTTGFGLGHTEFITSLSCPKSIPTIAASASGDRMLKLWDLSSGVQSDREGCVELSTIQLDNLPSCIEFSDHKKSFLVICEGLSGIVEVPIVQCGIDRQSLWKFDSQNIRVISLPLIPLAILSSTLTASHFQYASFSSLSAVSQCPDGFPIPVFYWTDREGRLHLPVSLITNGPVFSAVTWEGLNTGDAATTVFLRWWKHNREPHAPAEEERLRKRLRHNKDKPTRSASNPILF